MTIAVVVTCTILAFLIKEINLRSSIVYVIGTISVMFGIIYLSKNDGGGYLLFQYFFVALYSVFLVLDIQLIFGGNSRFLIPIDPRCGEPGYFMLAVLKLYIDIIAILISLLALLSKKE